MLFKAFSTISCEFLTKKACSLKSFETLTSFPTIYSLGLSAMSMPLSSRQRRLALSWARMKVDILGILVLVIGQKRENQPEVFNFTREEGK